MDTARLKIELILDDKGTIVGIKQVGDAADKAGRDVEQSFEHGSKSVMGMDTSMRALYATVGTLVGTMGFYKLFGMIKETVTAASDLQEVSSKFSVVFAGQESAAGKMARTLVDSYAMSTREAKQYLSSIQDLLVPMGMNATTAAKMSNEVVKLSADLGSFSNLPTAKVMDDIQSALVGNYETMKKYGVVLNESAVQQQAMNMGLASSKNELDAARKAAAAYVLILKGSAAAQGDMARTADSYANRMKQMRANVEELSAQIGTNLLPTLEAWLGWVNKILVAWNKLSNPSWIDVTRHKAEQLRQTISDLEDKLKPSKGFGFSWGAKDPRRDIFSDPDYIRKVKEEISGYQKQLELLESTLSKEGFKQAAEFAGDFVNEIRGGALSFKNAFNPAVKKASDGTAELKEYLEHVNNSLDNFTNQSEEAWYAYDGGITPAIAKTKELDTWLQKAQAHLAADESIAGMKQWVDQSFSGVTKKTLSQAERDYEHFLDRVQDLAVDVFETITDTGISNWKDMVDSLADTWMRFVREIAAQKIRQAIEVVITKKEVSTGGTASASSAGGFDLGSIFGGMSGGGGGTSMGSSGGMSVLSGITSGWSTYQSASAANEDIYGHGQLSSPELAAANSAISSFFANYYGGPIMGMINDTIVMPLMNNLIWGQKNLQWGLTGGPKIEGGTDVLTSLGRLGAYDKHQDIPGQVEKEIQTYLAQNVAPMADLIAKNFSDTELEAVRLASEKWKGGESAKITAEGLSAKSLDWLKSITKDVDGWMAELIQGWTGSLEQLQQYLVGRESTLGQMQATVDAIIRPMGNVEKINKDFDEMARIAGELHAEESLLLDIETARAATLRELAASEREAAAAEQLRGAAILSSLHDLQVSLMPAGQQTAAQWTSISMRYGLRSLNAPTAEQASSALSTISGWDTQTLAAWLAQNNVTESQFRQDIQWLQGIAATEEVNRSALELRDAILDTIGSIRDLGSAANTTYEDLARMAEQQASQWGGFGSSIGGTLNELRFGPSSQASADQRLREMRSWLGGMQGFDSYETAQSYYGGLQDYLRLAQEAYQRPSNEYAAQYEFVVAELTRLQEFAAAREEEQLTIIREQRDLLQQIADNTSGTRVIVINGQEVQASEAWIERYLASDRGRAQVQTIASGH